MTRGAKVEGNVKKGERWRRARWAVRVAEPTVIVTMGEER